MSEIDTRYSISQTLLDKLRDLALAVDRRPGPGDRRFKNPICPVQVQTIHDHGFSYRRLSDTLTFPRSTLAG
jgi:hypothetical protein